MRQWWSKSRLASLLSGCQLAALAAPGICANAALPPGVAEAVARGEPQELIVEFDARAVEREAQALRQKRGYRRDEPEVLDLKRVRYRQLKERVRAALPANEQETIADYSHLPLSLMRLRTTRALDDLTRNASVVGAYRNERKFPGLDGQSATLVGEPAAAALGLTGSGATVLVIDTGANYTVTDLGACTAPGTPASCKVVQALYADSSGNVGAGPNPVASTNNDHGTNVASIVAGVASGARIAVVNVFGATLSTSDSNILGAIDWGIANQATYSIRAMNLSLGDGALNTAPCSSGNPYVAAFTDARNAGIIPAVAAGNQGYTTGISNPACAPGAVSAGAVYSADFGSRSWYTISPAYCTDSTTAADQVACFSNSASFLTLLAPGALITAGGLTFAGTSQASPFIAAAAAILQTAYPGDTPTQTVNRLTVGGASVTDARNGIAKPRLNLPRAAQPANDDFVNRIALSGSSGQTTGVSRYASKEPGEPNHAGNAGGKSIWWKWTAPANGQMSLDTGDSTFSALLAVYSGSSVGALAGVASAAAGNLLFEAQANTEYGIAVDGLDGAGDNVTLNWTLNTTAAADLSISAMATPNTVDVAMPMTFGATVLNNGPQTATNVLVTATMPQNAAVQALPAGCSQGTSNIVCNLGSLTVGASASVNIDYLPTAAGTAASTVTASSDLPDPVAGNNSATSSVTVTAGTNGSGNEGDVPTLPEWGAILLAMSLLLAMRLNRRNPGR